jgi:hypothetical protein
MAARPCGGARPDRACADCGKDHLRRGSESGRVPKVQELAGSGWSAIQAELLRPFRKVRTYYRQGPVEIFLHEGLIDDTIAAVDQGATHSLVELVADTAVESRHDWVITASRR